MTNYMKSVFAKYKFLILFFAIFGILIMAVPVAFGINKDSEGWQLTPGLTKVVSAVGTTTKLLIKNTSATVSYFIPTKTATEIAKFMASRPAVISLGSCGNGTCENNFGESCSNCAADCGHCYDKVYEYQVGLTSYNPWDVKTIGGVCGDGVCDSIENPDSCAYDCQPGCCAIKEALPISNCGLYTSLDSDNFWTEGLGDIACRTDKGCKLIYSRGHSDFITIKDYNICGTNGGYVCERYNDTIAYPDYYSRCTNDPSCYFDGSSGGCKTKMEFCHEYYGTNSWACDTQSDNKCKWDEERHACVGTTNACWDNKNLTDCGTNPNCIWIGQIDSPKCYNYCGDGLNDVTETNQTCPADYASWSPNITLGYPTVYNQCGDRFCSPEYPALENSRNCPSDCGGWNTYGMVVPVGNGNHCGDGVCSSGYDEEKGDANYCYVDCGDIGEGYCFAFDWDLCDRLSDTERNATFNGCTVDYINYSINNNKATTCAKAKNRNECNRFGCYWEFYGPLPTCGDGTCNAATENCSKCPRDCGYCQRTGFCEGAGANCATNSYQTACQNAGCTWVIF